MTETTVVEKAPVVPKAPKVTGPQAPVVDYVVAEITKGITEIAEANKELLGSESGTKVADIDKALKATENGDLPEHIKALVAKFTSDYESYRKTLEEARNAFRTDVLGEEPKAEVTVDKEALKEKRTVVLSSVSFLKNFAQQNKNQALYDWAQSLEIPMAGRQGTSTAGQNKPRVFVHVDGTPHDTFGDAAKAMSKIEGHAKVTTAELTSAWSKAGVPAEGGEFEFVSGEHSHKVRVVPKPKKSDK